MNRDEFIYYLEINGSDISKWPANVRTEATGMLKTYPEYEDLLRQEEQFEIFLNLRNVEMHSPDLKNRIIKSATGIDVRYPGKRKSAWNYINEFLGTLNIPRPVISLCLVLILGIALGYMIDYKKINTFRDESDIGVMALYEGELYDF